MEKIPFQNTDVQWMAGVRSGSEDSRSSGCVAISVLIPGRSRAVFLALAWRMGKGTEPREKISHIYGAPTMSQAPYI